MSFHISVCIPVFNSEGTLLRALDSVAAQEYDSFEVIIVNDGSKGKDPDGRNCSKIVKQFLKTHKNLKKQIVYREHRTNLGLLEARRTAVMAATGDFILLLDSDDLLLPGCLDVLYKTAVSTGADIVQGSVKVTSSDEQNAQADPLVQKRVASMEKNANSVFSSELTGKQVFDGFLVKKNHCGFLWAKLIRRSVYEKALSVIPFSRCVFAEDFLQYFFITYFAQKYAGISQSVYNYTVDTGISSFKQIDSIDRWEQVCVTANVFTIIFSIIKEFPENEFSTEQLEALRYFSRSYLANNIKQLNESVIPKLKDQAYDLLCEYWGKEYVEFISSKM
ncbi:MAG: glycosyltransferase family 2 protein [Treponema sp.]|nr:glycosyltransferase family 2 protein [Treponema sp.]